MLSQQQGFDFLLSVPNKVLGLIDTSDSSWLPWLGWATGNNNSQAQVSQTYHSFPRILRYELVARLFWFWLLASCASLIPGAWSTLAILGSLALLAVLSLAAAASLTNTSNIYLQAGIVVSTLALWYCFFQFGFYAAQPYLLLIPLAWLAPLGLITLRENFGKRFDTGVLSWLSFDRTPPFAQLTLSQYFYLLEQFFDAAPVNRLGILLHMPFELKAMLANSVARQAALMQSVFFTFVTLSLAAPLLNPLPLLVLGVFTSTGSYVGLQNSFSKGLLEFALLTPHARESLARSADIKAGWVNRYLCRIGLSYSSLGIVLNLLNSVAVCLSCVGVAIWLMFNVPILVSLIANPFFAGMYLLFIAVLASRTMLVTKVLGQQAWLRLPALLSNSLSRNRIVSALLSVLSTVLALVIASGFTVLYAAHYALPIIAMPITTPLFIAGLVGLSGCLLAQTVSYLTAFRLRFSELATKVSVAEEEQSQLQSRADVTLIKLGFKANRSTGSANAFIAKIHHANQPDKLVRVLAACAVGLVAAVAQVSLLTTVAVSLTPVVAVGLIASAAIVSAWLVYKAWLPQSYDKAEAREEARQHLARFYQVIQQAKQNSNRSHYQLFLQLLVRRLASIQPSAEREQLAALFDNQNTALVVQQALHQCENQCPDLLWYGLYFVLEDDQLTARDLAALKLALGIATIGQVDGQAQFDALSAHYHLQRALIALHGADTSTLTGLKVGLLQTLTYPIASVSVCSHEAFAWLRSKLPASLAAAPRAELDIDQSGQLPTHPQHLATSVSAVTTTHDNPVALGQFADPAPAIPVSGPNL